jgi:hypothetical protein
MSKHFFVEWEADAKSSGTEVAVQRRRFSLSPSELVMTQLLPARMRIPVL